MRPIPGDVHLVIFLSSCGPFQPDGFFLQLPKVHANAVVKDIEAGHSKKYLKVFSENPKVSPNAAVNEFRCGRKRLWVVPTQRFINNIEIRIRNKFQDPLLGGLKNDPLRLTAGWLKS